MAESKMAAWPDPQIAAIGFAVIGQPKPREQAEGAWPPVRLGRRHTVHMRSSRPVVEWRDRQHHLPELRVIDGQIRAQQLAGQLAEAQRPVEVEQRVTIQAELGPQEMEPGVPFRNWLAFEQGGHDLAAL